MLGPGLGLDNASVTMIKMPRNLPKEFIAYQGRGGEGVGWGWGSVWGQGKEAESKSENKTQSHTLYNIHSVKQRHATP